MVVVVRSKTVTLVVAVNVKVPDPSKNFRAPVPLRVIAVVNVILIGPLVAQSIVPVNAPATKLASDNPLTADATVTVPPPDDASNVTVSPVVGTEAPPAPPVVADQCVVSDASSVPVPKTQNRFATALVPSVTCQAMPNESDARPDSRRESRRAT